MKQMTIGPWKVTLNEQNVWESENQELADELNEEFQSRIDEIEPADGNPKERVFHEMARLYKGKDIIDNDTPFRPVGEVAH